MEMCSAWHTGGGNLRTYRKFSRGLDRITKEECDGWMNDTYGHAFRKEGREMLDIGYSISFNF